MLALTRIREKLERINLVDAWLKETAPETIIPSFRDMYPFSGVPPYRQGTEAKVPPQKPKEEWFGQWLAVLST